MDILEKLNSGALHSAARSARPECVDMVGNIHRSAERADFVNWLMGAKKCNGSDTAKWTESQRAEYASRYVSS